MADLIPASSPPIRPTRLTYDDDLVPCHGPLLEDPPLPPLSSPLERGWEIAKHPDISPSIAAVALKYVSKEMQALKNECIGDALIKEEPRKRS